MSGDRVVHRLSEALVGPGSAVGLDQAVFAVDAGGQCTFRIPVTVPPGIAGLAPKLELLYGHQQPNGVLGVGWSLNGSSAITRIGTTYSVDGFAGPIAYGDNDRYALDGRRLVSVTGGYGQSGTVYSTEIQSWNHVRQEDDGFVVTAKGGGTLEYGRTVDSRILAAGSPQVRVWALNAAEDRNGNRVEYSYTQAPAGPSSGAAGGAYYLDQIRYTVRSRMAASRLVKLEYEARPDALVHYVGGFPVTMSHRLKRIATFLVPPGDSSPQLVRTYTVGYELSAATQLSRVVSIAESGALPVGPIDLEIARIVWQDTSSPGFDTSHAVSKLDVLASRSQLVPMDVGGRGRTDVTQIWPDGDGVLHATTYLASEDGTAFVQAADSSLDRFPSVHEIFAGNVDGDGRTDLVVAFQDPQTSHLKLAVHKSDGQRFVAAGTFDTGDIWDTGAHRRFFPMDANGDGRTDLVEAYADAQTGELCLRTYLSKFGPGSSGFHPAVQSGSTGDPADSPGRRNPFWAMDVNGDGMMDLVRVWRGSDGHVRISAYLSVGSAIDQVKFTRGPVSDLGVFDIDDDAFLPVDMNGDGIPDLLHIYRDTQQTLCLQVFLSDAAGGFVEGPTSRFPDQTVNLDHLYPMAMNGGGQVALVSLWWDTDRQVHFDCFVGSPSGTFRYVPSDRTFALGPETVFFAGDPDGNGKADLIAMSTDADGLPELVTYLSVGPRNDVISSLTNALAGTVSVAYAPISDGRVYHQGPLAAPPAFPEVAARRYASRLTPAQFPAQAVLGQALHVVQSYSMDGAASGRFPYSFEFALEYADAQINLLGRGWQGFRRMATTSLASGRITSQLYNQTFPFTGTIAEEHIEADGRYTSDPRVPKDTTVLMRSVTTSQRTFTRAAGHTAGQEVVEVLPVSVDVQEFHYGKDRPDFRLRQTFDYDEYGNLELRANLGYVDAQGTSLYPDEIVYRHYQYQNDLLPEGGWALGYLRYAKVTANGLDGDITSFQPGDLRLERRTYAASTYNLESRSQWDDTNSVWLTTRLEYDGFGNCKSETRPGGFVTRTEYDPDYQTFPMTVTSPPDAQGTSLVTAHGYDARFGVEVARYDPNGSVFITGVDGFGRKVALQEPAPPPDTMTDPSALTAFLTGSSELQKSFRAASVVTVETTAYLHDDTAGNYKRVQSLQAFAHDSPREYLWSECYVDGLAKERQRIEQSGRAQGDVAVLTNYDSDGKAFQQSLPVFSQDKIVSNATHWIVDTYDVLGRPLRHAVPAGSDGNDLSTTTWAYEPGGLQTMTSAAGSATPYTKVFEHHFHDGVDMVRRTIVPGDENATTTFDYDRLARLTKATDPPTQTSPQGVSNTISYDSLDRKRTLDNPDQNTTGNPDVKAMTYAYDPVTGQLRRQTDAAGQATSFDYDQLDRVTTKTLSDGRVIRCTYDDPAANGRGRLTQVKVEARGQSTESTQDFHYDAYGNVTTCKLTLSGETAPFVTSSRLDPQGRLVGQTFPDGTELVRQYSFGRLVSQSLDGAVVRYPLERYDALGRACQSSLGLGPSDGAAVVLDCTYNVAGQIYGEIVNGSAGPVLDLTYSYDLLGQILRIADNKDATRTHVFTYLNRRLRKSSAPGFEPERLAYDASGNLTGKGGLTYTHQAHFPVRGKTSAGVSAFTAVPDACGRTRTRSGADGVELTFDYDGLGCLRRVSRAGAMLREIVSDHLGQRLRQTDGDGTRVIHVSPTFEVTRPPTGAPIVTKHLIDDRGTVASIETGPSPKTIRYFRNDHKGSATHAFNQDGTIAGVAAYSGYGQSRVLAGADVFQPSYERRRWDATIGLYYFGARYYDPVTGRFLTPDSQIGGQSHLQQDVLNRYAFELNNPINATDETGHDASWIGGLILGILAIAAGVVVTIATAGMAAGPLAVLASAAAGALFGAGISASLYSVTHREDFSWKDWAIESSIGFVAGAVTGGVFSGLASVEARFTSDVGKWMFNVFSTAGVNTATDVAGQFVTNLAEGKNLSEGLLAAFVGGAVFGVLGGALGGGVRLVKAKSALRSVVDETTAFKNVNAELRDQFADALGKLGAEFESPSRMRIITEQMERRGVPMLLRLGLSLSSAVGESVFEHLEVVG